MVPSTSTNICAFTPGRERNPFSFCIEECAKGGYQVLDINFCECMNPNSRMRGDDWIDYVKEIKAQGMRLGVTFSQAHLPYYVVFAEKDERKSELMEELIRRSILACGMLGVRWAVTHPATVYEAGHDLSVSYERNLEYYAPHVALARENGLGICLENDFEYKSPPYQHIYCSNIYELIRLVDGFGDPEHVAVCYDFGHANLVGHPYHRKNLNAIGRRLKAVHVADNHGLADEHLMPFHGNIDWREAMAGLADIGYEGDLTYEIQEFGRFFPNEEKHLVVSYSLEIAEVLIGYFEEAKAARSV